MLTINLVFILRKSIFSLIETWTQPFYDVLHCCISGLFWLVYTCVCVCLCMLMKFHSKFLLPCTQLAIKALMADKHKPADESGSVSLADKVSVCDSVARLYADWPQMHLVWDVFHFLTAMVIIGEEIPCWCYCYCWFLFDWLVFLELLLVRLCSPQPGAWWAVQWYKLSYWAASAKKNEK